MKTWMLCHVLLALQAPVDWEKSLTPRAENDAPLANAGLQDNAGAAVYPPLQRSRDALADAFNTMSVERTYLSEGNIRKMTRYLEWSLETPLVNSERNELRRRLITLHQRDGGKASAAYGFLREGVGFEIGGVDLSALDDPFADHKRRGVQRARLPALQEASTSDELARWILDRYRAAHPALTAGPHPLTPQVAVVYAEHVVFALNQVMEKEIFTVTPEFTRAILGKLIADWPQLTAAKRARLLDLPFDWAAVKKGWPGRPEHEKTGMRVIWGQEFAGAFPAIRPMHEARVAAIARAEAEEKARRAKMAQAEAERYNKLTPFARNQLALQVAQMQFQSYWMQQQVQVNAMRQMQLQGHVTNMNIINNMNSSSPIAYYYIK